MVSTFTSFREEYTRLLFLPNFNLDIDAVNHFDLIKNVKSCKQHTYGYYIDFYVIKIITSFDKKVFETKNLASLCIGNLLKLHQLHMLNINLPSKVINHERKYVYQLYDTKDLSNYQFKLPI